MSNQNTLLIRQDQLDKTQWHRAPAPVPEAGQLVCTIERFALTANNISYADHGKTLGYWRFFPAADDWGVLPVWGFGTVTESRVESAAAGERLFGFFPLSSHLLMTPLRQTPAMIEDGAEHRRELPAVYNQYMRTAADPLYRPEFEAQQALFKPLFATAFVADDFLAEQQFYGAAKVLLSSASSKTAMAIAHLLQGRSDVACIGLTSAGNVAFTEGLGCYDQVVSYDELETLDAEMPVVYVDIAGNGSLRDQIHERWDSRLKYSCSIGGSHWQSRSDAPPAFGPKPQFLFAPNHVERRVAEWGAAEFQQRLATAWQDFLPLAGRALEVTVRGGPESIGQTYLDLLAGHNNPSQGYMAQW
ncbi:MAG: DUF2855 family protein [Pseudomonadota bacterium]